MKSYQRTIAETLASEQPTKEMRSCVREANIINSKKAVIFITLIAFTLCLTCFSQIWFIVAMLEVVWAGYETSFNENQINSEVK